MRRRFPFILVGLLAASILCLGCQATPKGPGVVVTVRAEPKTGYTPPADVHQGYGSDSEPADPADHTFHRIDYQNLGGIVLWVEPTSAPSVSHVPPLGATITLQTRKPVEFENVHVASVGGEVRLAGPLSGKDAVAFTVRTEAGELLNVPSYRPLFMPSKAGLVEILVDDQDEPVAWLYVSPTPWARRAVNGERVTFSLPPDRYRVRTWHPILPGSTQVVDVNADGINKVTATVGVNSLPKPAR